MANIACTSAFSRSQARAKLETHTKESSLESRLPTSDMPPTSQRKSLTSPPKLETDGSFLFLLSLDGDSAHPPSCMCKGRGGGVSSSSLLRSSSNVKSRFSRMGKLRDSPLILASSLRRPKGGMPTSEGPSFFFRKCGGIYLPPLELLRRCGGTYLVTFGSANGDIFSLSDTAVEPVGTSRLTGRMVLLRLSLVSLLELAS
mmetsp:Transcript_10836/g.16148  ORF Transcript_10836/g.16148 Transcript_10836/m.16148 type:complete len:201 (+) Transcript_10836:1209-1811(+)